MSREPEPPPQTTGVVPTSPTDRPGAAATANTAPMPRIDTLIGKVLNGRYRVTELIAKGGMGRVYKAEQSPLNRVVALKVLDSADDAGQDLEFRGRFILEAAATAKLTHPNTIRIFDYGQTTDDICYIAMEFLDGRTIHQTLKDEGPLAPERVVNIIRQVCSSLREAHALGLIHRDLKPSNVILLKTGEDGEFAKVLDFGLVKEVSGTSELTRLDAVVGSPSYMSPEQIRSTNVDHRSDIYSLGVLMYTCLVGKPPFTGVSSVNLLMAHLHNAVPPIGDRAPLQRTPTLEWAVMTCLEKEPANRFSSVDELSRALRTAAAELRGEKPGRPTLVNGRVIIPDEPTPSSSMRIPQPSGARVAGATMAPARAGRREDTSSSRSSVRLPARRGFPVWAVIAIGVVGLGLVVFIVLAAGGVYLRGQVAKDPAAALAAPASSPEGLPPPTPWHPAPLPGSQPPVQTQKPPDQTAQPAPKSTPPKPRVSPKPEDPAPVPTPAPTPEPPVDEPHTDLKHPWG